MGSPDGPPAEYLACEGKLVTPEDAPVSTASSSEELPTSTTLLQSSAPPESTTLIVLQRQCRQSGFFGRFMQPRR
jgi:hypothetical protein